MSGTGLLGDFEQLVLLAVLRRADQAYALPIRTEIEEATERTVSRGALYRTLDRLEDKGLVASRIEEPTPERGGHARKAFSVTRDGVEALRRSRDVVSRLSDGLEDVLEGAR